MTIGWMARIVVAVGLVLAAACSPQKTAICASTPTFAGIKNVIFYEARQRFHGDVKYVNDLDRDLLVAVAAPTEKGVTQGITDCLGRLQIDVPTAYRDAFHGEAALTADIAYSAKATADGDGGAFTVSGYDAVLGKILDAANGLQARATSGPAPTAIATAASHSPPSAGIASGSDDTASVERAWYVTGLDPNGDNWLALKAGPGLSSARLAKLGPDTILMSDGRRSGEWLAVRTTGGLSGWVSARYVACCRN